MNYKKDFAIFILTHGRPDNQHTYDILNRRDFTGQIYFVIDNKDQEQDKYIKNFGDKVKIFDKDEIAKTFDTGDNFKDQKTIVYARNACFGIAKELGIKYFAQFDDDYKAFDYRFNANLKYNTELLYNFDTVFQSILKFYINSNCASIAISQGGDWIGGSEGSLSDCIKTKRKAMNSFFCSTDRPFNFMGRINEDVNTYTHKASQGMLFLTLNQVSLTQRQTQSNEGGMTDTYLESGTYVKSFYSVMYHPSGVKISILNTKNSRIHHQVKWDNTAPKILSEKHRRPHAC